MRELALNMIKINKIALIIDLLIFTKIKIICKKMSLYIKKKQDKVILLLYYLLTYIALQPQGRNIPSSVGRATSYASTLLGATFKTLQRIDCITVG